MPRCVSLPADLSLAASRSTAEPFGDTGSLPCSGCAPAPALPTRKEEGSFSNTSPGTVPWWVLAEDRCGFTSIPEGCSKGTMRSKAGLVCSGTAVVLAFQGENAGVATPKHCVCPRRGVGKADGRMR